MEENIKYPINRDKFKQGCISIFKNGLLLGQLWIIIAILRYYNEDKTLLEINEYLEMLYYDILTTIIKNKASSKLIDEI